MNYNNEKASSNVISFPEIQQERKPYRADLAISQEAIDSYTESSYSEALWVTTRYISAVLPRTAYIVLEFLLNRTLRYHKTQDNISISQMIDGVVTNDELQNAGTGLSKNSVIRSIRLLTSLGLVDCTRRNNYKKGKLTNTYTVNYKTLFSFARELVVMKTEGVKMTKLKISKKYQESRQKIVPPSAPGEPTLVPHGHLPSAPSEHTQSDITQSEVNSQVVAVAPTIFPDSAINCKNPITSSIESAKERSSAARAKKSHKVTCEGVKALWTETCLKLRPGHPVISANPTKVKRIVNFIADSRNAIASPVDFFEWVVSHWPEFAGGRVEGWKTKYGDSITPYPDLAYFAIFLGWFKREYAKHQISYGPKVLPSLNDQLHSKDVQIKRLEASLEKLKKEQGLSQSVPGGRYWE